MSEPIFETIELTKDFHRRRAVDKLNLRVFEGDIYGFLGPNGAGKSTTIRMLTGLVRPSHGTARIMGYDVRTHRTCALRRVGALVESPSFYKYLSARTNLEIFSRLSGGCDGRRIDEVLDTVGLLDRADDGVKTFSHGMLQRLGIAQALLPDPKLVILDEPTNGLDPQGMKDVRDLILRLAGEFGVTIFLSSHLLHEVEQTCTRVGIISGGRLLAEGSVDELLRREVELVELTVDDERRAAGVLSGLDWVDRRGAERASKTERPISRTKGPQSKVVVRVPAERIPEVNRALVEAGVDVYSMTPKTMTLEDLFLQLVGEGGDVC